MTTRRLPAPRLAQMLPPPVSAAIDPDHHRNRRFNCQIRHAARLHIMVGSGSWIGVYSNPPRSPRASMRVLLAWWALIVALAQGLVVGPAPRTLRGTPLRLCESAEFSELAFDDEGDVEGGTSGLQLISNSVEHIKALQRNEQSLSFYKSFGTWNNEYVSAKVNMALNLEIATLSRIAASSAAKPAPRATKRAKAGKKGGVDGKPRRFKPKRAADAISDDEVRSGLIALLTLYDLAHNTTAADESGIVIVRNGDSGTAATTAAQARWNNPESPEQLARFVREVEALGSGAGLGSEAGVGSASPGGLRVAGAKASWKQALRQSRREEADASSSPTQHEARTEAGEGGLDVDRIVINDLARSLLEMARGDLLWRLGGGGGGAEAGGIVDATVNKAMDAESAETGQPDGAASAVAALTGDKRGRVRGRERARSRKQETGDLAEYEAASSGGASPNAGRAVVGAPFLAAPKRHTEISKVTRELFARRDGQLFSLLPSGRPYCSCLQELCVVLLLWAHRASCHEVAGLVIASMARHHQAPPLETVAGIFEGEYALEGSRGREGYWAAFLEVFRAIKPAVVQAALSPDAEAGASGQATAVRLLGLGVTASIRAGLSSRSPSAAPVSPAAQAKRKAASGSSSRSGSGSKGDQAAAKGMGFDPSEVYDNLSVLLRTPVFNSPAILASAGGQAVGGTGAMSGVQGRAVAEAAAGRAAFVSGAVKGIIQAGHLDTALAAFHLTLQVSHRVSRVAVRQ